MNHKSNPALEEKVEDDQYENSSSDKGDSKPGVTRLEDLDLSDPEVLDERVIVVQGEEHMNLYTYLLCTVAGVSGFLFGYDTGVISTALVNIGTDIGGKLLTNTEKEWTTTGTSCGGLIGAFLGGNIADKIGRKWALGVADIFFTLGAVIIAASYHLETIIIGRIVLGIGVGCAAAVTPLYLSELSPTRLRGKIVTINVLMLTIGSIVAYGFGTAFSFRGGWRLAFAWSIIPAGMQAAFIHKLPESPRYDLITGHRDRAVKTMRIVYKGATDEQIDLKLAIIQATVDVTLRFKKDHPTFGGRLKALFMKPLYRRPLIVACVVMFGQQLCGFNTLFYYSATIFEAVGLHNATATSMIVSVANFVGTFIAMFTLDKVGKRRMFLITYPGMIIGLALAAMAFHFMTIPTGGQLQVGYPYEAKWTGLMLGMMILFVLSYATGLGNIPWQNVEFFPLEVRGMGAGFMTASNWSSNILLSSTFLTLMNAITPAGAFGLYSGICFLSFLFIIFCFPEAQGLSLEDMKVLFSEDFGVRKSERMRRARKEALQHARQEKV